MCAYVHVHVGRVYFKDQKWVSESLELELEMIQGELQPPDSGAENGTLIFWKSKSS